MGAIGNQGCTDDHLLLGKLRVSRQEKGQEGENNLNREKKQRPRKQQRL